MRKTSETIAAVGTTNAVPVDKYANPVSISVSVVSPGTATFSVEYTYDDIQDSTVTPTWWTLSAISGATATKDATITFPIQAVRLHVTAWTSGTLTFTVLQARVA